MENEINKLIKALLEKFGEGEIDKEIFISKIRELYFEDIGFAKIDHHRNLRRNFPEVIFGQNKTPGQIVQIAKKILNYSKILLVTRTSKDVYRLLKKEIPHLEYNEKANLIFTKFPGDQSNLKEGVTVICAGTSDIGVAEEAAVTAYLMGNNVKRIYDIGIAGIHRLLNYRDDLMKANVIVAVAGMEGALPGVVSSLVDCLVIGVPSSVGYGANFNGLSPLLTMLNSCSPGIVIVNIDNGFGAGYAAGMMNLKIL
jgi:pyridinium-3,5-biscarboxylic acid mononucleotide synthase